MNFRFNPDEELRQLEQAAMAGDEEAAIRLYYARLRNYNHPCDPSWETENREALMILREFIEDTHQKIINTQKNLGYLERQMAILIIKEINASRKERLKRCNPLLIKKGKIAYAGEQKLKESSLSTLRENTLFIGPFGPVARFFGFDPETTILCFLEDPANRATLLGIAKGEIEGTVPMFPMHRPIGGRGTLDQFWDKRSNKKLLAGAVQFVPDAEKKIVIITHMSVKNKWRRQYLNTKMIQMIQGRYPGYELLFHEPTTMGEQFMKRYGYKEFKPQ